MQVFRLDKLQPFLRDLCCRVREIYILLSRVVTPRNVTCILNIQRQVSVSALNQVVICSRPSQHPVIHYIFLIMPQHRFTALYRSVSNPFRKAVIPSRVWGQSHFGSHPILKPPSKALKCQFSSAIPRNASARFAQRPPQTPQPPPPETEPEPEYYTPPPVPPKKTKEPGSGLAKLFLAITIPVLFLTSLDNIARKGVSPDEVRQALGLNPNTRPSPVAYDYYIYNNRPDLVPYIQAGVKMKENFSFRPLNFSGNNLDDPFRWWTLVTPQFNHGGPLHLFINYTAFMALAPPVVQLYGPGVTVICFLVGGIIATTIVGFYEKATNPFMKMSPAEIKLKVEAAGPTKEDKRLYRQATSWHMGASTSLMALGT